LCALACAAPLSALSAADPLVATPFEVRQQTQDLLTDLAAKRGERGALCERVRSLLDQYGDQLVIQGGTALPISEALVSALAAAGWSDDFARLCAPAADQRLAELDARQANEADLRRLARSVPGTPAARRIWRRLADRAWEQGRFAAFLACARLAGDAEDAGRKQRLALVESLATTPSDTRPPESVAGISELWRLDLGEPKIEIKQRGRRLHDDSKGPFALANGPGAASALSDGHRLAVFDHITGTRTGNEHELGEQSLARTQMQIAVLRDGFAALGMNADLLRVVAVDAQGRQLWQRGIPLADQVTASAPVALDDLIVLALLSASRDGTELRALALHAADGTTAWDVPIARLPGDRPLAAFIGVPGDTPPALAVSAGSVVVCANDGLLARVGADGVVRRVWTYPSQYDQSDRISAPPSTPRSGAVVDAGGYALVAPADGQSTTLVIGPDDVLRTYTGDNAGAEIVATASNAPGGERLALLVGRRATLLDVATLKARWTAVFAGDGTVAAQLNTATSRAVLAGRGRIRQLDLATGSDLGETPLPEGPVQITAGDELLVVAQNWTVTGLGHGTAFMARLTAAAAAGELRPLISLASLHEARGERAEAFTCLMQALTRGGPPECAERAATLARRDLTLALGDVVAFPPALDRFRHVARFDRHLEPEALWWSSRQAELTRDTATAIAGYRTLAAQDTGTPVPFPDRLETTLGTLAELGLARLGAAPMPAWLTADAPPGTAPLRSAATTTSPGSAPTEPAPWTVPGATMQRMLVSGDLLVGVCDGLLTARSWRDGGERWFRAPKRPLLGVSYRGTVVIATPGTVIKPGESGLQVEILPGSAAAAAGLKSGDRLLTFNGHPVQDFESDLRRPVAAMKPRDAFTATVQRDGSTITCTGRLGGDPVEPIAADASVILAWPLTPGPSGALAPEGMWFSAHDPADGRELWRWSLPPATTERAPTAPLLASDGVVVALDGGDVVGLDVRSTGTIPAETPPPPAAPANRTQATLNALLGGNEPRATRATNNAPRTGSPTPSVRWRLAGAGSGLAHARMLTPRLLWLPQGARNQVALVDTATGRLRALLPVPGDATALLVGDRIATRDTDGRVLLWNLATAQRIWRGEACGSLVAVSGDALLALDDAARPFLIDLADGTRRRTIGEWSRIETLDLIDQGVLVHARSDNGQSLALLTLPGGTVRWEITLPARAEIHRLLTGPGQAGALLGDDDGRESLLLMDAATGALRTARRLDADETVPLLLPGGTALVQGPAGMHTAPPALPAAPPALPTIQATASGDLVTTANGILPKLAWQPLGAGRYAIARLRRSILIFADLPTTTDNLDVLPSDAGPRIEGAGSPVRFTPDGPVFTATPGGWRFAGTVQLTTPDGMRRRDCVRLDPPVELLPGSPVWLRATCGNTTDAAPDAPWWLHQGWREMR
jgi:outer membrane protein assembly factor BamB